jgi:hypothetical protein
MREINGTSDRVELHAAVVGGGVWHDEALERNSAHSCPAAHHRCVVRCVMALAVLAALGPETMTTNYAPNILCSSAQNPSWDDAQHPEAAARGA